MRSSRPFGLAAALAVASLAGMAAGPGGAISQTVAKTSAVGTSAAKTLPAPRVAERNAIERAMFGGYGYGGSGPRRWPGRGWSVAHDRRMARKRRNKLANRKAQR